MNMPLATRRTAIRIDRIASNLRLRRTTRDLADSSIREALPS